MTKPAKPPIDKEADMPGGRAAERLRQLEDARRSQVPEEDEKEKQEREPNSKNHSTGRGEAPDEKRN